jgi:hypothetical protein
MGRLVSCAVGRVVYLLPAASQDHVVGESFRCPGAEASFDCFQAKRRTEMKQATPASGKTIYTCSMHPEVQQDHPGDCPKCGMKLVERHGRQEKETGMRVENE